MRKADHQAPSYVKVLNETHLLAQSEAKKKTESLAAWYIW